MFRFALIMVVLSWCTESYGNQTPLITDRAKDFAVKQPIKKGIPSYSGFLNGTDHSRMFFWFFPSERSARDPLIVWIDGDLTSTSVRGLFENNGPVYVKPQKGLNERKHYWSQKYNVLYLDSSIHVGFSHALGTSKKTPNLDDTINNLYESLSNFFGVFDRLKKNDVYISGSDMSCKLITKLSLKIDSAKTYNLKGLIIENGFCDPFASVGVAHYFLSLRIIDKKINDLMINTEQQIISLMRDNKFNDAFDKYDTYIKKAVTNFKTIFNNYTDYDTNHNLMDSGHRNYGNYVDHLSKSNIRHEIHVNKTEYQTSKLFLNAVRGELMKSSAADLGTVLNKFKVLMYFGQMNPDLSPKAGVNMVSSLKWCSSGYFNDLTYNSFFVNGELSGYNVDVKNSQCKGSLAYALIRGAGKDVADHKPEATLKLIEKFISDSPNQLL